MWYFWKPIGYGVRFAYVGPAIAFIVFTITLLIITGIRDILSRGQFPW